MVDYGYDVEKWIEFLIDLKTRMLDFTGNGFNLELLSEFGRDQRDKKTSVVERKVVRASDLFESDREIENYFSGRGSFSFRKEPGRDLGDELSVEVIRDRERLTRAINNIVSNPKNWIVSEIKKENNEVTGVQLKPLDVSPYCKGVFEKCDKTLMMSATILDSKAYCRSLGLEHDQVKFIHVESDFPLQNRPIYPLNIARLNFNSLQLQEVKVKIAMAINDIMTLHKNHKGLIHTTSYETVEFY
jgi:ATP-dependent DNA helicase DinG